MADATLLDALRRELVVIAEAAGAIALRDFRRGGSTRAEVQWKNGGSPVTAADLAADAFLAEALIALGAKFPALGPLTYHSEEQPRSWTRPHGGVAFVVDPIDGTRDFMDGGDAWCIVIGVAAAGVPLAGAVHMPATGRSYSGGRGAGAYLDGARVRLPAVTDAHGTLRVTGPRSALDQLGERLGRRLAGGIPIPALAHRVLAPLAGVADLAVARGGGHDWDIVASDCILREAGGRLLTLAGRPLRYTLAGEEHPPLLSGAASLIGALGLDPDDAPKSSGSAGKTTLRT